MFSFLQDFLISKEVSKKLAICEILIWLHDIFGKYQIKKEAIMVVFKVLFFIKLLVDCYIPWDTLSRNIGSPFMFKISWSNIGSRS